MKKLFLAFLLTIPISAFADRWDRAVSKNAGNTVQTQSVTSNTSSATALIDETNDLSRKAAVIDVFNNSAYTVWVGSNTTSLQTTGFPILSSSTYTTDGAFTGTLYGITDSSAGGNTNVRIIYYLKNDALN